VHPGVDARVSDQRSKALERDRRRRENVTDSGREWLGSGAGGVQGDAIL
jgi:hypothetical protein